jgi:hypothetical protein
MKKTLSILGVIVLSFFAMVTNAQTDTVPQPAEQPQTKQWDPKNNPTVSEINARYEGKMLPARPALTQQDIFPVIGTYESTTNPEAANVSVAIDPENKGVVWIDGLPQGRVKAMLRKSPATYKIPAQKTEDGKDIAEGTLVFDKDTKTLSILLGKSYNATDPAAVFATPEIGSVDESTANADVDMKKKPGKTKIKVKKPEAVKTWTYTGTKVETETVKN